MAEPSDSTTPPDSEGPALRPIPGAPPGADVPAFPTGPSTAALPPPGPPLVRRKRRAAAASTAAPSDVPIGPTGPGRPEPEIAAPDRVQSSDSVPSFNEITEEIRRLHDRSRAIGREHLETMITLGKRLKFVHTHYCPGDKKFVAYVKEHVGYGRTYAFDLLTLGDIGDKILDQFTADAAKDPNFVWPHWTKVVSGMRRDAKRLARGEVRSKSKAQAKEQRMDAISAYIRERDDAQQRAEAITQQWRNARSEKEELQEAYDKLAADHADLQRRYDKLAAEHADLQKRYNRHVPKSLGKPPPQKNVWRTSKRGKETTVYYATKQPNGGDPILDGEAEDGRT